MLINNNGMIINAILRKVSYDPQASFEPICNLVTTPQLIVVNRASPYRTLAQLVEAARQDQRKSPLPASGPIPPSTSASSASNGWRRSIDLRALSGGAPAVNALLGGHVSSAVLNWSEIAEQWAAGNVRALATMASRRIDPLPDLPTVAESGYKDFETDVWFGLVAPAGTPQETVSALIDWFGGALAAPEVKSKLTAQALYPIPVCGGDFAAHIGRQIALYTRLLRELISRCRCRVGKIALRCRDHSHGVTAILPTRREHDDRVGKI